MPVDEFLFLRETQKQSNSVEKIMWYAKSAWLSGLSDLLITGIKII